ncbi:uncharacterized protein LOC135346984 [Halichondria panicea]|uniref:uncharacterized protein LOC135346984 n=1 Tax=Halichondria panicea TaxID=6063 RepID=UPI00312BB04D
MAITLARRKSSLAKGAVGRRRSSMGEYIPRAGGRPLSAQCYPTPGPGDYDLQGVGTVGQDARKPSMHALLYPLKLDERPSPTEYDTSQDAAWRRGKRVSLTAKRTTWPYQTRKDAHLTEGPGSGGYNLRTKPVGPKRTMSARHREGLHAGYPNFLVQPVDTLGFATPGPPLTRPDSVRGAQHSMGLKLPGKKMDTVGPGPDSYILPKPIPPTALIGEKLDPQRPPDNPAPNTYTLPSTPHEGKTFGLRSEHPLKERAPPPNTYSFEQPRAQSAHFTHRAFPWKSEQRPSPAEYSATPTEKTPEYTCRENCLPVYPDILLYPEHEVTLKPGVGEYNTDRDFADNSNPAYSVGLPLPIKPNSNPGPNKYVVDHTHLSTLPTPPSYTMRPRVKGVVKKPGPGPAQYSAPQGSAGKAFSMTPRRQSGKGFAGPPPNAYQLDTGLTHKGAGHRGHSASMKGRPTPLQYNGFSSTALVRLATLS